MRRRGHGSPSIRSFAKLRNAFTKTSEAIIRFPFQPNASGRLITIAHVSIPIRGFVFPRIIPKHRPSYLWLSITIRPGSFSYVIRALHTHTHTRARSFLTSVIAFVRFSREIRTNQRFYRRCSRIKFKKRVKCLKKSCVVKRCIFDILFSVFFFSCVS